MRNPDLAHTYELLARRGTAVFYDGRIGRAVVRADDHPKLEPNQTVVTMPGIMEMSDLRSYRTRLLAPTKITYRGRKLSGMAPPSSGGSTEGEILNILSGYKLGSESRVTALLHYLEASRLAYADRDEYVGDPRYVRVPPPPSAGGEEPRSEHGPGHRHTARQAGVRDRRPPAARRSSQLSSRP